MPFTTYYFKYFSNLNKTVYARQKEKKGSQEASTTEVQFNVDKNPPEIITDMIRTDERQSRASLSLSDERFGVPVLSMMYMGLL